MKRTAVYRTLRFQLVAIVVLTVAGVLAIDQWLDTTLSERAMERDLKERAELALGTIDSLWGRTEPAVLARTLASLNESNRDITAIDVFRLDGTAPEVDVTTRDPAGADQPRLTPAQVARLAAASPVTIAVRGTDGTSLWRVAVPLQRGGRVVGAAQVDVSLAEAAGLRHRLRVINAMFLVLSTVMISMALAFFLERRVARPVAALVGGMRQAEAGALHARVESAGGGEFSFLGGALNRMLSRIEDLTAGLESRVRAATRALAVKNRELQEANEKLWRAQLEIGRSERLAALGQMAATIAHELGTPLNSVLGYTQLLLREPLAPEHAAKLTIVESQVQRMNETIRSVLDRTRDRDLRRVPVAVAPIVADALAIVSARLDGREIALQSEIGTSLPSVPADAIALRQVLLNLLTNAIDATTPPGSIMVSARVVSPNGRPGRVLEIAVRDSGHGMTPEEQRRVFEPFYSTKGPGHGTGLGLAIVEHIVRAHGGQMVVESAPGAGTTMRVRLPLEAAA